MQVAFAAGCCPARCSADAGGAGSTRAGGRFGCKTHLAERVGARIFLDGFREKESVLSGSGWDPCYVNAAE